MPADGQRSGKLVVSVVDGQGRPFRAPGLGRWLAGVAPARARGEVTVAFASGCARARAEPHVSRRGRRPPTCCRSQRAWPPAMRPGPGPPPSSATSSSPAASRGARPGRRRTRSRTEWRVLALHGLLHLLGYDHEADTGAMRRLEQRLRRRGGLQRRAHRTSAARAGTASRRGSRAMTLAVAARPGAGHDRTSGPSRPPSAR